MLVDYPATFFARDTLFSKHPTSVMIIIYHLHSPNILLHDLSTNFMTDIANNENNFILIELNPTTLANNPAYKMVWTKLR